jgi:adenosylmethionine-8-amino-7-oxononanoate aminotransferase
MILAFDVKPELLQRKNTFSREMFSAGMIEGILIRPIGNTIYVMPPYILSTEEAMQMGASVQRALNQVLL